MKGTIASLRLLSIYMCVCVYDCMFFCLILPFEVAVLFHFEIFPCLYPNNKICKTRRDPTTNKHLFKWSHSHCDGISDGQKS